MSYNSKEKNSEYNRTYYLLHRDSIIKKEIEYNKVYSKTPMGRAQRLLHQYKRMDERNGFGKDACDFNAKWIVENIFSSPCKHCGESDWRKIGCNRLDNNKPHTKDNVEPCCFHCNCKLNGLSTKWTEQRKLKLSKSLINHPLKSISVEASFDKDFSNIEITFPSMSEAERNGYSARMISRCILKRTKDNQLLRHKKMYWRIKR